MQLRSDQTIFWLQLQNSFDLMGAERKSGEEIARIEPY